MGKRVYVAGPWVDREFAKNVAATLAARGYEITQDWWNFESRAAAAKDKPAFLNLCAELDKRGVRTADAVVLINSSKSEGKAVEQGLAIAYGIPIIAIGNRGEYSSN